MKWSQQHDAYAVSVAGGGGRTDDYERESHPA